MRIGILGLPQAGKRTLFTLLTGRAVTATRKASDAPEGLASIRDPRVDVLARICRPRKVTYAENNFVLCPDIVATTGMRHWLDSARRCDMLCLLVRSFESEQVFHPAGSVDPARDRANLEAELILADLELVLNRLNRIEREKTAGQSPAQVIEERALRKCSARLDEGRPIRSLSLPADEQNALQSLGLITRLPILWTYNVSEDQCGAGHPDGIAISCRIEQEITEIEDPAEREEFLQSLGLSAPGVDRFNAAAYDTAGLMSFYTIGSDEVRAWTIRKGSLAPIAGGKIHSDIERGFIRVEVLKYDDLVASGSERSAKEQGKIHVKGRDYVIEDGDTCHFLHSS